jgi:hypothetical protein
LLLRPAHTLAHRGVAVNARDDRARITD